MHLLSHENTVTLGQPSFYAIDTLHTSVHFRVRHLMIAWVRGEIGPVSGFVSFDPNHPYLSEVVAQIDATGIDTGNVDRDLHLRSSDFFDVERFPTINFRSRRLMKSGSGYLLDGELTLKGVTKRELLVVELSDEIVDPEGKKRRAASATTIISRQAYGVRYNQKLETGGVLIGDEVEVTVELELVGRE